MKKGNLILATICIILGLYVISVAMQYPAGTGGVPGPGVFPIMISVVLIASSIAIIVSSLKMEDVHISWLDDNTKRVYLSMVALLVYVFAMAQIGFVVTSVIFMTGMTQWFRKGKPIVNAGISVAFVAIVYFVFGMLLNVPLNFGILI
ncbi:MAG: hypothetical protein ATN34_02280 [Epulopiscium sp. Nele67-Bin002]|nr:MAG: hypothetical protein BEN18_08195 [Epulopiscium sp. Nuni2H_MBin001]OON91321.1 MAG: hypothetical protein ATN34_02280 [Epulopiscium sp. Nele67-Bin002]OON91380.1 MAG: hypothetical protein ATN33_01345 [Epulopiscium sp. Nele67-Bin001]